MTRTEGSHRSVTAWQANAPIERVWDVIVDAPRRADWWRGVLAATPVPPPGSDGLVEVRPCPVLAAAPSLRRRTSTRGPLDPARYD
jgi:hypothetical protein